MARLPSPTNRSSFAVSTSVIAREPKSSHRTNIFPVLIRVRSIAFRAMSKSVWPSSIMEGIA